MSRASASAAWPHSWVMRRARASASSFSPSPRSPFRVPELPHPVRSISKKGSMTRRLLKGNRVRLSTLVGRRNFETMRRVYAMQAGLREPFSYSKKQSDSTLLIQRVSIDNSATPSGMRGGLRRRFRHIRNHSSLRLITLFPTLVWRLHTV